MDEAPASREGTGHLPRSRFRGRVSAWLDRQETARLLTGAVLTFCAVFGILAFARWNLPSPDLGIDTRRMLEAGVRLQQGTSPWVDTTYYYAPLMALLAVPFTSLPTAWVVAGWAAAKIALVVAGAWLLAPSRTLAGRLAAVVAACTFLPVMEDVWQGNVSVPIAAAMAIAVWGRRHWSSGVPMGLIFAVAPKPILLPFAAWMLVWRPRALVGAAGVALAAVAVSALIVGPGVYLEWIRSLPNAGLSAPLEFPGNIVLAAKVPDLTLPAAAAALLGLVWVLWKRDELTGLVWATTCGVFLTPFGGEYNMVPLLLVASVAYLRAPRRTLTLAPIVQALLPVAFSIVAALVLAASITLGPRKEPLPLVELARERPH